MQIQLLEGTISKLKMNNQSKYLYGAASAEESLDDVRITSSISSAEENSLVDGPKHLLKELAKDKIKVSEIELQICSIKD